MSNKAIANKKNNRERKYKDFKKHEAIRRARKNSARYN